MSAYHLNDITPKMRQFCEESKEALVRLLSRFVGYRASVKLNSLSHVPFFRIYVPDSLKGYNLFNQYDFGLCWG